MSDKKQSDVKQPGWLCKVWLWVKRWWLPIAILLITSTGLACALSIPQQVFETPSNLNDRDTSTSQNPGTPDNKETSHAIQSPSNSNNRDAPVLLAQSNLRLAFLYITGGAIAVVGLIETFRKNNNEKLKNDQDKEKNDREHLRQVRADRRERYAKAVEQLGDEKAPIRMGGVYTLVGLVDEWLEDESIDKYEDRLKEGQVIINNLCAYIRSPFTLASHYDELDEDIPTSDGIYKDNQQEFYADKATLESEADVRLSIIKEIHDRLQDPEENTPGTWSEFEYNFSGSRFFYSVDLTNSYYTKSVNFSGSTYKGEANFSHSTYQGEANFSHSTYQGWANFSHSTYQGWANFSDSTYQGWANFSDSTYKDEANFSGSTYENKEKKVLFSTSDSPSIYEGKADFSHSTYQGWADFSHSTYQGWADFSGSTYKDEANFSGSTYKDEANFSGSTYEGWADFRGSTYEKDVNFSSYVPRSTYDRANFSGSTYKGKAEFSDSTYQGWADFRYSTYEGWADFRGSTYKGWVYFRDSTYEGWADFTDSTYKGEANFTDSTYEGWADFRGSTYKGWADFRGSTYKGWAYFSRSTYKGWADFRGSTYKNETDFSGSIFYQETYFGEDRYSNSSSCFTNHAPQFYDKKKRKNTLFGSHNNDFTVDIDKGYPIDLDSKGIPLNCKFLTSEQKEYLADKFREIEKINNKLREVKDLKEKAELSEKLRDLNNELHKWREEATTVNVEDVAAEDTES